MPESKKYLQSGELSTVKASSLTDSSSTIGSPTGYAKEPTAHVRNGDSKDLSDTDRRASIVEAHAAPPPNSVKLKTFLVYFSEWRHLKVLLGTSLSWFFVDVAFYGLNLNQSVLLTAIGFSKGATEYDTLLKNGYGNLIIAAAGYVPGYFFTIYFIEILGRRWIQIQGFLVCALMFGVIAGDYKHLGTVSQNIIFPCHAPQIRLQSTSQVHSLPGEEES